MSPVFNSSLLLMAAGMATVFVSLMVFLVTIVVLQKIFKPSGEEEN